MNAKLKDEWSQRHRYCHEIPEPMELDEARFVLTAHAEHGVECVQFISALAYAEVRA
ncbi:hypothetical protein [Nocardia sp. CDC160]|uniref:hypothetical protein n=1 Tax=Nocardia sp. CDC160 TaxID=3112166 RepID=UPI002DC007C6|nr:hypothetical protein [Nocardia sp. CDC160]MEC3915529.1 hypothetical protein [Nocardia sp. CDC160]